jgi:hypothetical protein
MWSYGKFNLEKPTEFWDMRVYCWENVDCDLMNSDFACCAHDAFSVPKVPQCTDLYNLLWIVVTTLSVLRLHSHEWYDWLGTNYSERRIWNNLEKTVICLNAVLPSCGVTDGRPRQTSVRTASVRAWIRTVHFSDISITTWARFPETLQVTQT